MAGAHLMSGSRDLHDLRGEQLTSRLIELPGWTWQDLDSVSAVSGGISNLNWRVGTQSVGDLFVKVPGLGADDFVDRRLTHTANVQAALADVAPAVLYYDEASGVEVFEFLDGYRGLSHSEISSSTAAFDMIDVYRKLHRQPLLGVKRTVADDIDDSLRIFAEQAMVLPPWGTQLLHAWRRAWQAISASGFDLVPSHNDPNFTNMMFAADKPMRLVDYEFCSDNDPAYDIGTFLGIFSIDDARRYELLEDYFGRYDFATDARCHLLAAGMFIRYGLWCLVQAHTRDSDFDYEKYGLAYFVDALAIQADPRWESWVAAM